MEKYFGHISFPDNTHENIDGAWLIIEETRMYIEVGTNDFANPFWPVVIGNFTGMGHLTFIQCEFTGGIIGGGGSYRKMIFRAMLKGIHITDPMQLQFTEFRFDPSSFVNWMGYRDGLSIDFETKTVQIPETKTIFQSEIDGFQLIMEYRYGESISAEGVKISRVFLLRIVFTEPQNIDQFLLRVHQLRRFMLFMTMQNLNYTRMFFKTGPEATDFSEFIMKIQDNGEDKYSMNFSVPFENVGDQLAEVFQNWFGNKKLHTILELLQEGYFNPQLSVQRSFLNMCVAIESFDSLANKDKPVAIDPDQELAKERRQQILALLVEDDELHDWFEGKSSYWHNRSFMQRLEHFKSRIEFLIPDLPLSGNNLMKNITLTRNGLAHRGIIDGISSLDELRIIGKTLELTLKLSIMDFLNVPVKNRNKSLENESQQMLLMMSKFLDRKNN